MPDAVLFDLDGTFADTAPDLGAALNRLREDLDLAPMPLEALRPYVSQGVRGMLKAGLNIATDAPEYAEFQTRFLVHYGRDYCIGTTLFPGIAELVNTIEARGMAWGIVTNKSQRFALPLMEKLGYARRAACIVSGDSAPRAKPSPMPMQLACVLAGCRPETSFYAGDDLRDIAAGKAVGMRTVAVRYGYLGDGGPIESWGADHLVDHPTEIAALLPTP